jgi:hypothetical protein
MINPTLSDVNVAFVHSVKVDVDEDKFKEFVEKNQGYQWMVENPGSRHPKPDREELNSPISDYLLVEKFFLSKRLYHNVRKDLLISRVSPNRELTLKFPLGNRDSNREITVSPDIVFSYYRGLGVLTTTIVLRSLDISVQELIFLKSLRWMARTGPDNVPKIKIAYEDSTDEASFTTLFDDIIDHYLRDIVDPLVESDVILDSIEVHDSNIGVELFERNRDKLLFGLLTGDEGYRMNTDDMVADYLENGDIEVHYREYFRYYYTRTSLLGLFSEEYPNNKRQFAGEYAERHGYISPQTDFINLVSSVPNLSDGHLLTAEVALVRYTLLREIDRRLNSEVAIGKTDEDPIQDREIDALFDLKHDITQTLTHVDLLTNSDLWVNLPISIDHVFGYKNTRKNLEEKIAVIDETIQSRYNKRQQKRRRLIALASAILTLVIAGAAVIRFI